MRYDVMKHFLRLLLVLFGITFLTFALLALSPGDPAQKKLSAQGVAVTKQILLETREEMGLNKPFIRQYGDWLFHLIHGDLGNSYKDGTPVLNQLLKAMNHTLILAASAFGLSIFLSVPLGLLAAVKKDGFVDQILKVFCFAGNAIPSFLLSVLLIYYFCIRLNVFSVIAKNNVQGLFLPTVSLAIPLCSRLIRQVRAAVLNQLEMGYVKGARQRGVRERYILVYNVLRNSMISVITISGLTIGTLMGGSVVVESIFLWPGVGKLVMDSITARDYPMIQGYVILMSVIYVMINLLTDGMYHVLDPRHSKQG